MTIPRLGTMPPLLLNPDGTATVPGLHLKGGIWYSIATLTASFTFATTMQYIRGNAASGAIAGTLPAWTSALVGYAFALKKVDSSANAVSITPSGTDTIDGVNGSISTLTPYTVLSVIASDVSGQWDRGF